MVLVEDEKDFSIKCRNKFSDYRKVDKRKIKRFPVENESLKTINLKDAFKLVSCLDTDICDGCGCNMLFCHYVPYCLYQFSFDRINNNKIHSIDNLRIICWNCNSSGYGSSKENCSMNCHIADYTVK